MVLWFFGGVRHMILAGKIMSGAFLRGSLDLKAPLTENWRVACEYIGLMYSIKNDHEWLFHWEQGHLRDRLRDVPFGHLLRLWGGLQGILGDS